MRKILSLVVSVGIFSGVFSGMSGTNSCFARACFFSKKNIDCGRCVHSENEAPCSRSATKKMEYSKFQERKCNKKEKSGGSRLGKIIKFAISFALNMFVANKLQDMADQTGLTNSSEFTTRTGNLWKISKKFPNIKKISVAIAKKPQAIKDVLNIPFYSSVFSTIFSILGKGMNMFGLPNIGSCFGAVFGAKMAVTNKKTFTEIFFQNAANFIDDDGDEDESGNDPKINK